jgi:hypothetical protein
MLHRNKRTLAAYRGFKNVRRYDERRSEQNEACN